MVTLKNHRPVTVVLRVPRVKCTSCGRTHALLPEMLIPYSSYSLRFVLTVLEAYFLHAQDVYKRQIIPLSCPARKYRRFHPTSEKNMPEPDDPKAHVRLILSGGGI